MARDAGKANSTQRSALISIDFPSKKLLRTMLDALTPETKRPATSRARVSIEGGGKTLTIRIRAKDTSALRATLNSYLRWVALIKETIEALTNLEEKKRENT